jgi:hypothetical protein
MPALPEDRSSSILLKPIIVFGVMGLVLALRLARLCSAMLSQLT